jgi:hypothetical protein
MFIDLIPKQEIMIRKVRNKRAYPILLKNAAGDVIQLNANAISNIDDSFLFDYDITAIQIMQNKTIITTVPEAKVEETPSILETSSSEQTSSKNKVTKAKTKE